MRITRRAERGDLASLLDVYRHLNPAMPVLPEDRIRQIWNDTLASTDTAQFVSVIDRLVVSTCLLVTGPNLMRGGAPTRCSKTSARIGTTCGKGMGEPPSRPR